MSHFKNKAPYLKSYTSRVESQGLQLLEANRPGIVTNVSLANEGDSDEQLSISLSARYSLGAFSMSLDEAKAIHFFKKAGFDTTNLCESNEGFVLNELGETQGARLELFVGDAGKELYVNISIDAIVVSAQDLIDVPDFEREAIVMAKASNACSLMLRDFLTLNTALDSISAPV